MPTPGPGIGSIKTESQLEAFIRNRLAMELARAMRNPAFYVLKERADPANPPADTLYVYGRDNGSGKTQLCVLFSSGTPIVLATQA